MFCCCHCTQCTQNPREEVLVAFFSKDLKTASPEERELVAAVAVQDAVGVEAALKQVCVFLVDGVCEHEGFHGSECGCHRGWVYERASNKGAESKRVTKRGCLPA